MRDRWTAFSVIALAVLLFFAPVALQPGNVLYSDHSDILAEHVPAKRFLVRSWQETGEIALWCPYSFGGMPFVHDIQVGVFYPPHWPLLLLPEACVGAALSWLIVLHVFLGGCGAYVYGRSRGLDYGAALVAGLGFAFAGKWLLHVLAAGHYILVGLAWLPLVLLFLERALRRGSLVWATVAGGFFALLILGTGPQWTFYTALFIPVWTLGTALEEAGCLGGEGPRSPRRTAAALGRWAGLGAWAVLVAVGLSAVQLLPTLEAVGQATRSSGVAEDPGEPRGWLSLRNLLGVPRGGVSWEDCGVLGGMTLALALLAPLRGGARVRFQAAVCLLFFALALGAADFVQDLPGFRLFRTPGRLLIVVAFPLSFLAAVGLQNLFATLGPAPMARRLRLAAGGVLVAELWVLTGPLVAVRPEAELYEPSACVRYLAEHGEPRARVLDQCVRGKPGLSPLGAGAPLALTERLEALSGCNPLDVLRYKEYLQMLGNEDKPLVPLKSTFTFPVVGDYPVVNKPLLDLLGVRYLLQPSDTSLQWKANRNLVGGPSWHVVCEDEHPRAYCIMHGGFRELPAFTLWENRDAFPRAFVVPGAAPLPERAGVLAAMRATDFRKTVLLEGWQEADAAGWHAFAAPSVNDRAPVPDRAAKAWHAARSQNAFRAAQIVEYRPNRVTLDLGGGPGGWLVLADVWYPGWVATVDGQPAPVRRGDFLFRALAIPDGCRRVVFSFEPASYLRGRLISLVSLALVGIIGAVHLARRLSGAASARRYKQPAG